jgi:hypothetical protein
MTSILGVVISNDPKGFEKIFHDHATSTEIVYDKVTYSLPATRAAFCDESKTLLYVDSKDPNCLLVYLQDVDLPKMGEVMGSEGFQTLGTEKGLFKLESLKVMTPMPPPAQTPTYAVDMFAAVTTSDPAAYSKLFWEHAESTTIHWGRKPYEVPACRKDVCDESKTKLFHLVKDKKTIAIMIGSVDAPKLGAIMTSPGFEELGGAKGLFKVESMALLSDPPSPFVAMITGFFSSACGCYA